MGTETHQHAFTPDFPFDDSVLLPPGPMTDEEFAEFVKPKDNEIPIELVDFSNPC